MKRWILPGILIGSAFAWFGYNLGQIARDTPAAAAPSAPASEAGIPDINSPRPEFTLNDLDGKPHHIKQWDGKVIVLNFWATWCPPCREEIPLFNQLQAEYGDQGLQFIGIAVDDLDAVKAFTRQVPLHYPSLIGQQDGIQVAIAYGNVKGYYPYSVIIDRQGRMQQAIIGGLGRADIEQAVLPLLKD